MQLYGTSYFFVEIAPTGLMLDHQIVWLYHFCTTPDFLPQFEHEERDLRELIALGEKAGSEIWVERNTQKLQRVLPVIQVLKQGNLHHPAGKTMREYTPEERAKQV
ncbi:MAG TPA: hypothetical protein VH164_14300 [Ktedonobacteraceae bacterium]|nr:hypothetical protein [Ktedonobacteraceae bacterium]